MNLIICCTDFFFSWLGNEFCKRSFTIKWVHSIKAFDLESEIAPFWHIQLYQCVGPENINTPITEVHWKFRQGGGSQRPKSLKEGISLNWNFQRGRGFKPKNPLWEEGQHNTIRIGIKLHKNENCIIILLKIYLPLTSKSAVTFQLACVSVTCTAFIVKERGIQKNNGWHAVIEKSDKSYM